MPNEFLDDLAKTENGDVVPPTDSSTVNDNETQSNSDDVKKLEENVPFHQHPRWKAREQEWQEKFETMKRTYDEELGKVKQSIDSFKPQTAEAIPEWYKYYYGEDAKGYELYKQFHNSEKERIKQEALEEIRKAELQEQETTQKWNNWIEDQIKSLEDNGKKFDRNKLLKQMEDYPIYGKDGLYDFNKSYELYEKFNPSNDSSKSEARKEIANNTTSGSKGEPKQRDYVTAREVRGRGFPRFTDN